MSGLKCCYCPRTLDEEYATHFVLNDWCDCADCDGIVCEVCWPDLARKNTYSVFDELDEEGSDG